LPGVVVKIPNCRRGFQLIPTCLVILLASLPGCGQEAPSDRYQGYVEGEYLYLASPQAGFLESLEAPRGMRVQAGQRLFSISPDPDLQALSQAEAQAISARERVKNLKAPRRAPEIAALEAQQNAAEAGLRLSEAQLSRQQRLAAEKFIAAAQVDEARAARDRDAAQVDALKQQIATYQSALGRRAEVGGAEADLQAAQAQVAQKRWQVERKSVAAPADGEIAETYYRPGEWVSAGAPVASLLPDGRRRLRFFVPETVVAKLAPGQGVTAACDGCDKPIHARIDFIAAEAEYTPPVIYSQGSREKLVFRVEAVPEAVDEARRLRPGLPVDVRLADK
jgi:HlyD family secretion protein